MKKRIFIVLLTFVVFQTMAQEWTTTSTDAFKSVLLKCSEIYRGDNYALTIENRIYRNPSDPSDVIEQRGTFIHGSGKVYRSQQGSQLTIQTTELKLVVDTVLRQVGIMEADTLFDAMNLTAMLEDNRWETIQCVSRKESDYMVYRLTGVVGFHLLEFKIHQKTNQLRKLIATLPADNYLSERIDDETTEQPRIELTYSAPSKLTAAQKQLLTTSEWIVDKGNAFQLTTAHADYTLQDLRYTKTR